MYSSRNIPFKFNTKEFVSLLLRLGVLVNFTFTVEKAYCACPMPCACPLIFNAQMYVKFYHALFLQTKMFILDGWAMELFLLLRS